MTSTRIDNPRYWRTIVSAVSAVSLVMIQSTFAQLCGSLDGISVRVEPGRGTCSIEATEDGRYNIFLRVSNPASPSNDAARFEIQTTESGRSLGAVTIDTASNRVGRVSIGTNDERFVGVRRVRELGDGVSVLEELFINGDIGDGSGQLEPSIEMDQVDRIEINGEPPHGGNLYGGVTCHQGPIDRIVVEGDVRGPVIVSGGGINTWISRDVFAGDAKAPLPLSIRCAGTIGTLRARRVTAAINTLENGAEGSVLDFECLLNFSGSLDTYSLGNDPRVTGFVVGRGLGANIRTAAGGLQTQVIVARDFMGGGWGGKFTVGSITLDGIDYTQRSSILGGGAVGLVRYNLYREDSSPVHNGYRRLNDFSAINPVSVAFFGPVARRPGSGDSALVRVEYHVPYSDLVDESGAWYAADNCFIIEMDPLSPRRLNVMPNPSFRPGPGLYRVSATPDLVCGDIPSTLPVRQRTYWFWLALDCNGNGVADSRDFTRNNDPSGDCNRNGLSDCCDIDLGKFPGDGCTLPEWLCVGGCACNYNLDGQLDSRDFSSFITCFFGGSCLHGQDADFNRDDAINSQDMFDFLSCFFTGC